MPPPDKHRCNLSSNITNAGLLPLPPNSPYIKKILRRFRKLCILNPKNIKSKAFFRNKSTMLSEQKRHARSRHYFIIHPFSKMSSVIEIAFFFAWWWQYYSVPLINGIPLKSLLGIVIVQITVSALQWLVFLSFFFLGYVDYKKKEIVVEPKRVVIYYLSTYFIFDCIAVAYDEVSGHFLTSESERMYFANFWTSAIVLGASLTRMPSFLSALRHICKLLGISNTAHFIIYHLITCGITIHIFACFLYTVPMMIYGNDFPAESWLRQANIHNTMKIPFFRLYSELVLVVVCHLFGASHELYEITLINEQIVLTCITIFGRLYTLYVLADLLKMFGLVSVSESKFEQYLGQLEEYMSSKDLPEELRSRLLSYYEYKMQKHYFNEPQILSTLSEHLRTELFLFGARKLIEKAVFFKSLPKATLGAMFSHMKSETFLTNDVITKIGGQVENIYFISSGTVAVWNKDGHELCHLEDGDEFGFISLWTTAHTKQLFKHVAVDTTEIYFINKRLLVEFFEGHNEIVKYFESRVKARLERYAKIQESLRKGGADVLSTLRTGKLLEKQNIRSFDIE